MARVEICVESADSACAAEAGGADRVELCLDRTVGGLTPPASESRRACWSLSIPVHLLIRPRAGDFSYSTSELRRMSDEVREAKECGASGVVFGALTSDGSIDREATAALADLARPLSVTFHKAFDLAPDPLAALDLLVTLGVDRVLTSGQAPTARAGLACLAALVSRAAGRIAVMAGGSLSLGDVPALLAAGVPELHAGSCVADGSVTRADKVRALVSLARDSSAAEA